ncbi:MAG: Dihydropteroate synthase [Bacteroidetes bacterium ADurb.Bin397]|nr:MAG: Dihydropteroate synthase [Bacteroidetes bacterium ADurb.Bin397]
MNNFQESLPPIIDGPIMLNCKGQLINLDEPKIMGILNVTPDSFYDGGKFTEEKAIIERVQQMVFHGATFIDIGAQSTRPGAVIIEEKEEIARLIPAIKLIIKNFPEILISADTLRSVVAKQAVDAGASLINDVSGGDHDPAMFDFIAQSRIPYILMHMQGTPETMQTNPEYDDVVPDIYSILLQKVTALRRKGVKDIILDPGFGFGKTVAHNFKLLKMLGFFRNSDCPVLAGISRKSMICKTLQVNPVNALNGTTALHMAALMNGASILRVHDVKEAAEVVKLYLAYQNS